MANNFNRIHTRISVACSQPKLWELGNWSLKPRGATSGPPAPPLACLLPPYMSRGGGGEAVTQGRGGEERRGEGRQRSEHHAKRAWYYLKLRNTRIVVKICWLHSHKRAIMKHHLFLGSYANMHVYERKKCIDPSRVLEPELPGAGVFGWSWSRHFGPAPASVPAPAPLLNIC